MHTRVFDAARPQVVWLYSNCALPHESVLKASNLDDFCNDAATGTADVVEDDFGDYYNLLTEYDADNHCTMIEVEH